MNTPNRVVYTTTTAEANMRKTGKRGMLAVANAKNRIVECLGCGEKIALNAEHDCSDDWNF